VQSQAKSPPSVSILLAKDSAHFQFPYDVFADDALARECPVLLFLLLVQLSTTWLLLRCLAVAMQFLYPLIAFVGSTLYLFRQGEIAPLEQFEIVLPSLAGCDTDDLAGLLRDDALCFLRVALLLSAIVAPLFFSRACRQLVAA
jgi:hypothetical protein